MTEKEIFQMIKNTYPSPAFATLPQVRNQTGFSSNESIRTADAITLSLFPSRGLFMAGFEIKISRSDWLKEITDISKQSAQKFCDYWWVVAADEKIVDPAELPLSWGLAIPNRTRLKTVVRAPKLAAQPLNISMLCGLLRNITEHFIDRREIQEKLDQHYQMGKERAESSLKYDLEKYEELKKELALFEKYSGIRFGGWQYTPEEIGNAVRMILEGEHMRQEKNLRELREKAFTILQNIDNVLLAPKAPNTP